MLAYLAIVRNAALNTEVHVSFQMSGFGFFGYIPRSGIAGQPHLLLYSQIFSCSLAAGDAQYFESFNLQVKS